jgi:hypothetical protein
MSSNRRNGRKPASRWARLNATNVVIATTVITATATVVSSVIATAGPALLGSNQTSSPTSPSAQPGTSASASSLAATETSAPASPSVKTTRTGTSPPPTPQVTLPSPAVRDLITDGYGGQPVDADKGIRIYYSSVPGGRALLALRTQGTSGVRLHAECTPVGDRLDCPLMKEKLRKGVVTYEAMIYVVNDRGLELVNDQELLASEVDEHRTFRELDALLDGHIYEMYGTEDYVTIDLT